MKLLKLGLRFIMSTVLVAMGLKDWVMDLLLQLVEDEASTLIYVTHSADLAAQADQTWSLHSGVLEKP